MSTLADYYARRAPEYERVYQKAERQEDLRILRRQVAQVFQGRRVLEIACGTGWWTEALATSAHTVVATDINKEVLTIARTKPIDSSKVTFFRADAFQLHTVPGGFDAALAAFWWSHLTPTELHHFLDGLHDKLPAGSTVLFIDNVFVPGSSTEISRRDAGENTYQRRRLEDGSEVEVLKNFPADEQIRTALAKVTDPRIERLTYYWSVRYQTPD